MYVSSSASAASTKRFVISLSLRRLCRYGENAYPLIIVAIPCRSQASLEGSVHGRADAAVQRVHSGLGRLAAIFRLDQDVSCSLEILLLIMSVGNSTANPDLPDGNREHILDGGESAYTHLWVAEAGWEKNVRAGGGVREHSGEGRKMR